MRLHEQDLWRSSKGNERRRFARRFGFEAFGRMVRAFRGSASEAPAVTPLPAYKARQREGARSRQSLIPAGIASRSKAFRTDDGRTYVVNDRGALIRMWHIAAESLKESAAPVRGYRRAARRRLRRASAVAAQVRAAA